MGNSFTSTFDLVSLLDAIVLAIRLPREISPALWRIAGDVSTTLGLFPGEGERPLPSRRPDLLVARPDINETKRLAKSEAQNTICT